MSEEEYSVLLIWGEHRGWITDNLCTKEKAMCIAATVADNYQKYVNFQLRNSLTVGTPRITMVTTAMIDRSCSPAIIVAEPYVELSE